MSNVRSSASIPCDLTSYLNQRPSASSAPYQPSPPPQQQQQPGYGQPPPPTLPYGQQGNVFSRSEATSAPPFAASRYQRRHQPCQYETFLAYQRRRMPYTLGGEFLTKEGGVKEELTVREEQVLTEDIKALCKRLLPTDESNARRRRFLQKIERLLRERWPLANIDVHVFGSTGSRLNTRDSDIDVCITSSNNELENQTCAIAALFANNGMDRVICIPHAKVPIVKMWDPKLHIACDLNVNKTSAIENTRMVQTYVNIDERVRPLILTIKYWTKRRQLNDAALGNTLSSYTWTCLVLTFLQTRSPPILPSLHRIHREKAKARQLDYDPASFESDLSQLRGYGSGNVSTLGKLLFEFFRYYAHEIQYETAVISVREGTVLSKEYKGWHCLQNNRICVEEPFNTSRNLSNTADDSSFRGIHLELRRAFKMLTTHGGVGGLSRCCEEYGPQETEGNGQETETEKEPPPPHMHMFPFPYQIATPAARATMPTAHFLWFPGSQPNCFFPYFLTAEPRQPSSHAGMPASSPQLTPVTPLPAPLYPQLNNPSESGRPITSGDDGGSQLRPSLPPARTLRRRKTIAGMSPFRKSRGIM